jgi:hypothetical protein
VILFIARLLPFADRRIVRQGRFRQQRPQECHRHLTLDAGQLGGPSRSDEKIHLPVKPLSHCRFLHRFFLSADRLRADQQETATK